MRRKKSDKSHEGNKANYKLINFEALDEVKSSREASKLIRGFKARDKLKTNEKL